MQHRGMGAARKACANVRQVLPRKHCKRPCSVEGVVRVGICTRRHFIRVLKRRN